MINVSQLSFSYNLTNSIRFPDFSINKGEHCLLLGESGSGKTTLLHLMGGLLRGYSGEIRIKDKEISTLSESALDHFRAQSMGFIFQKNHLIQALNVKQNLLLAPYLGGQKQDTQRVDEVLGELDLTHKKNTKVSELSQGQAQRVAIGRSVINNPSIILADEPTSALDDTNCKRVIDLLLAVANHHQSTLVIATHDYRIKDHIKKQIQLSSTSQQLAY
ncbi:MAG: ABC transporter ATP-binding protein [Flammeovirgaceae bacterium]|nr:ABC transporter ATP-binding protein [Flammeovirgaceae bacterium]